MGKIFKTVLSSSTVSRPWARRKQKDLKLSESERRAAGHHRVWRPRDSPDAEIESSEKDSREIIGKLSP
jgi:hypothetical protein